MGIFAIYVNITLKTAREIALQNELLNLRMSIEHYRVINDCFPRELSDLLKKDLTSKGPNGILQKQKFLQSFRTDKEGNLLDPFCNKYSYDNKSGKVWSQTKGYQSW